MKLRSISLTRGDTKVFRDLDLELSERRIGLIGPNGSGKSSLLRLLKGLIAPDSGSLERQESIGFVFQNPDHQILFPTVMEELCFGPLQAKVDLNETEKRADRLLHQYGAENLRNLATHELSDGQKQLVCILSVLMDEPTTLLLDEPFASLDQRVTRHFMNLMSGLSQNIIMATHNLDLLTDFDRVIWLEAGAICRDGKPLEVIAAYRDSN